MAGGGGKGSKLKGVASSESCPYTVIHAHDDYNDDDGDIMTHSSRHTRPMEVTSFCF